MTDSDPQNAAPDPTPAALTREQRVQTGYYIYGLIDPQALRDTGDELLSIFYVGKGLNARWKEHERKVLQDLAREEVLLERRGSKAQRIRKILERGEKIPAIRLSAGYVDEQDAYSAESLAIDTIDAALKEARRPPLTNATPGHYAGFVALHDHFVYTQVEEEVIPSASTVVDDITGENSGTVTRTEMLVKGTDVALLQAEQRRSATGELPAALAAVSSRVAIFDLLDESHPETMTRRGWDPQNPWTEEDARDRASRYWPFGAERVAGWLQDPGTMPRVLLLGIPSSSGQTVVRYAWEIDRAASWSYYHEMRRWGIPLGRRLHEHPRLGKCLYEDRNGRRVQVLYGYTAGVRVLDSTDSA